MTHIVGTTGGQTGGKGLTWVQSVGVRTVPTTDRTTGKTDLITRHRLNVQQTTSSMQMQGPQPVVMSHIVVAPSGAQRVTVLKKLVELVVEKVAPVVLVTVTSWVTETRNVTLKKPGVVDATRETSLQVALVRVQEATAPVGHAVIAGVNTASGRHTSNGSVWKQKSSTWGTSMQMGSGITLFPSSFGRYTRGRPVRTFRSSLVGILYVVCLFLVIAQETFVTIVL